MAQWKIPTTARIEANFIVDNGNLRGDEETIFFQGETCRHVPEGTDMLNLLCMMGVFQSRGQARKNWTRTGPVILEGFTDLCGIGKLRHRLTVLCCTPANKELP